MIVVDTILVVGIGVWVAIETGFRPGGLRDLLAGSALPALVFLAWALGIFATAAAVVAIALYGFRERWFWRILVLGCAAWLVFPPIHSLIGLLGLVLLIKNRSSFPRQQAVAGT